MDVLPSEPWMTFAAGLARPIAFPRHRYDIRRSNSKAAEKLGPGREGSFSEGNAYRLPPPALSKRNAWRFCEVVLSPIIYTTSHLDKIILRHLLVAPNYSATSLYTSEELCATCKSSSMSPLPRCADLLRDRPRLHQGSSHGAKDQHTAHTSEHPHIHNPHDRLCSCLIVDITQHTSSKLIAAHHPVAPEMSH